MIRRLLILIAYFLRSLFFSVVGAIFVIASLVYWAVFFPPGQQTPDLENYVILVGVFGAFAVFLATISVSARASRLENYPLITRLPSRVEYMTAVFLGGLLAGLLLQLLVAGLALVSGPSLTLSVALLLIPLWLSVDILAAVLALHATDLVTSGWSRVIIFGILAILLILNSMSRGPESWLADRLEDAGFALSRMNLDFFTGILDATASGLRGGVMDTVANAASTVFWPFRAMTDAVFAGGFTSAQALAPAVLLLYATILYLIAANLLATKDLEFTE